MPTFPDPMDLFLWLFRYMGVPGVILTVAVSGLALWGWWKLLTKARGVIASVTTYLRSSTRHQLGDRAYQASSILVAACTLPISSIGVLKLAEAAVAYSSVLEGTSLDAFAYIQFVANWNDSNIWIRSVGVTLWLASLVHVAYSWNREPPLLSLLIGFPLAGLFWLIGFCSALEATTFLFMIYFKVPAATPPLVAIFAVLLLLSIAGFYSLIRLGESPFSRPS